MEELYKALETLNKEKNELKKSKEYKIGKSLKMYSYYIMKLDFKNVIKNLKNKIASRIIHKKYYNPLTISTIVNNIDYSKCKIAVYTCILGNYDNLQIPLVRFENLDYYILTDNEEKYSKYKDIYKVIKISNEIVSKGNIIANRYVKFHPSDFFNKYDYAIYIDGNVRVISDIRQFVRNVPKTTGIAMHTHRERQCIYEEAEVCKLLKRGNRKKIDEQVKRYRNEGFPKNFGMNEATVIVSDMKNKEAKRLLNEWYDEFIISGSLRDQLAWPYILWKNNYKVDDIGVLGSNIYENYKLEMLSHE